MKKILAGVVLVFVVAGAATPLISGLIAEKAVRQSFQNLNQMYGDSGSGASFEIIRYNRGYLSSEIEWKIELGNFKTLYDVEEIIFVDRAAHGLSGVVTQTSLEKNKWFSDFVDTRLAGHNPLKITTEYTLSGTFKSVVEVDAFSIEVEKEVLEVMPGRAVISFDDGLKHFQSDISLQSLFIKDKLNVEGISIAADLTRISTYIWQGGISYHMEKGVIKEAGRELFCDNLKGGYTLDHDHENKRFSVGAELGAESIDVDHKKLVEPYVRLAVNNMDAVKYEAFMKLYTDAANRLLSRIAETEYDPGKIETVVEEQMATAGLQMLAAYEKLLNKDLEIAVTELHADLPAGTIRGNGLLRLKKDTTFLQLAPAINQPALALDIFYLKTDISVPSELIGSESMLRIPLQPGMRTGLFVEDGDNLVHRAETQDGRLILNGEKVVFQ